MTKKGDLGPHPFDYGVEEANDARVALFGEGEPMKPLTYLIAPDKCKLVLVDPAGQTGWSVKIPAGVEIVCPHGKKTKLEHPIDNGVRRK